MSSVISVGVNPDDVSTGFPVPKAGKYLCNITGVVHKTSKNGNPMSEFALSPVQPIPCIKDGKEELVGGMSLLTLRVVITPKSLFSLKELQIACGMPTTGWRAGSVYIDEFIQFIGKTVSVQVENKEYEGRLQAEVKHVFKA